MGIKKTINLSKDEFQKEYFDNKKKLTQIGNMYGVSKSAIKARALDWGFVLRPSGKIKPRISIGLRFDQLTIINVTDKFDNKGHIKYDCICDCGNSVFRTYQSLIRRGFKCCDSCRATNVSKRFSKSIGELTGEHWNSIKKCASSRNLPFEITQQFAWDLYLKQNKKCNLSGVDLILSDTTQIRKTASLDRINSYEGYTPNNVQWVHKFVNKLKMKHDEQKFIDWCILIAKHQRNR